MDIYAYKAKKLFDADFFNNLKDKGSLREDLLQLITVYQKVYKEIGAEIINNYFYLRTQDKDSKKLDIHKSAIEKYLNATKNILENAQKRGENVKEVSPVTLMLPFDLIRTENLIRSQNISKNRLSIMVDEVLLRVFGKSTEAE